MGRQRHRWRKTSVYLWCNCCLLCNYCASIWAKMYKAHGKSKPRSPWRRAMIANLKLSQKECTCLNTHIHLCTYVDKDLSMCTYVYMGPQQTPSSLNWCCLILLAHACVYIYMYIHVYMWVCMRCNVYACERAHTITHTHTCIYRYIYTERERSLS